MEASRNTLSTQSSVSSDKWYILGRTLPKSEIVFLSQVLILYTVIIASLVNLSLGSTSETWLILVSTSLGAILPNPQLLPTPQLRKITEIQYPHRAPAERNTVV